MEDLLAAGAGPAERQNSAALAGAVERPYLGALAGEGAAEERLPMESMVVAAEAEELRLMELAVESEALAEVKIHCLAELAAAGAAGGSSMVAELERDEKQTGATAEELEELRCSVAEAEGAAELQRAMVELPEFLAGAEVAEMELEFRAAGAEERDHERAAVGELGLIPISGR